MCNNLKGIDIGKSLKLKGQKSKLKFQFIQKAVIDSILNGKMVIIKKNQKGLFLDTKGSVIPSDSLKGKWINSKCLVRSNFLRP